MAVELHHATDDDLAWVERAVRRCALAMVEFGGFYGACATKLAPLLGPDRTLLVVTDDTARVGFVDADRRPDLGVVDVAYFVIGHARRQGIATRALLDVAGRHDDTALRASVSPRNLASAATARAAGFVEYGVNEWGETVFIRPTGRMNPVPGRPHPHRD